MTLTAAIRIALGAGGSAVDDGGARPHHRGIGLHDFVVAAILVVALVAALIEIVLRRLQQRFHSGWGDSTYDH